MGTIKATVRLEDISNIGTSVLVPNWKITKNVKDDLKEISKARIKVKPLKTPASDNHYNNGGESEWYNIYSDNSLKNKARFAFIQVLNSKSADVRITQTAKTYENGKTYNVGEILQDSNNLYRVRTKIEGIDTESAVTFDAVNGNYKKGQIVRDNNKHYISKENSNTTDDLTDTTKWTAVEDKGPTVTKYKSYYVALGISSSLQDGQNIFKDYLFADPLIILSNTNISKIDILNSYETTDIEVEYVIYQSPDA